MPELSLAAAQNDDARLGAMTTYLKLVPADLSVNEALDANRKRGAELLRAIPAEKAHTAYAPGKWTVAQLWQHLLDGERVFQYRAMCFARGEQTELPGFDHSAYADAAPAAHRSLAELGASFERLRVCTQDMFASFSDAELARRGTASGKVICAGEIGWAIAGHAEHHFRVLETKYI